MCKKNVTFYSFLGSMRLDQSIDPVCTLILRNVIYDSLLNFMTHVEYLGYLSSYSMKIVLLAKLTKRFVYTKLYTHIHTHTHTDNIHYVRHENNSNQNDRTPAFIISCMCIYN